MQLFGNCFCFGTAACAEILKNVTDVAFRRCKADAENFSDFRVAFVGAQQVQHLLLGIGQLFNVTAYTACTRARSCFKRLAASVVLPKPHGAASKRILPLFAKLRNFCSVELLITVMPLIKITSVAIVISISLFRGFVIMPKYDFCVRNFAAFHVDPMRKILYNKSIRRGIV